MAQVIYQPIHLLSQLVVIFILYIGCCEDCEFPAEDLCETNAPVFPVPELRTKYKTFYEGEAWGEVRNIISLDADRNLWLCGKTYTVDSANEAIALSNSLIIENASALEIIDTRSNGDPSTFFPLADSLYYYLPQDAIVNPNQLQILLIAVKDSLGLNPPLVPHHVAVATLSLQDLRLLQIDTLMRSQSLTLWGIELLQDSAYTYIYGLTQYDQRNYEYHLARTARNNLLEPWEYFAGSQWKNDVQEAIFVTPFLGQKLDHITIDSIYYVVSLTNREEHINLYEIIDPTAGTIPRSNLYCPIEKSRDLRLMQALIHPQSDVQQLIIFYNIVPSNAPIWNSDRSKYVPNIIRVEDWR